MSPMFPQRDGISEPMVPFHCTASTGILGTADGFCEGGVDEGAVEGGDGDGGCDVGIGGVGGPGKGDFTG